jgi:ribonuclease HII
MLVAGVDDAGRGAVLGPLVIAGVVFHHKDLNRLKELGVKDSKQLSSHRREQLAAQIRKLAIQVHTINLDPAEIDKFVRRKMKLYKLNRLEAKTMAKVIATLKPEKAFVDASDVLADRYKHHILECLPIQVEVISEHKADEKYPIVSAASIIAKVERDEAVSKLKKKHGELGCGYPTDPQTIRFLEHWIKKFRVYPDFVRKSWKPAQKIKRQAKSKQVKLTETF